MATPNTTPNANPWEVASESPASQPASQPSWEVASETPIPHDTIASDATKVPNARIRNMPNPAEGMTPGQALVSGAEHGIGLASIPSSPAMVDYAAMLGKEGVQQIAKMAAEHPKAAQLIARTLSRGVAGYAGEKLGGHTGAIVGLLLSHSLGL